MWPACDAARGPSRDDLGNDYQSLLFLRLQAMAIACERILAGFAEVVITGGTETMSMIPMGDIISPNPYLMNTTRFIFEHGLTAENLA